MFDRCPAAYLRRPGSRGLDGQRWWTCSVDGQRSAFELAAEGHWRFKTGHGLGDPPPPKLWQAVWLFEREQRAKDALRLQASKERQRERERSASNAGHEGQRIVAKRAVH